MKITKRQLSRIIKEAQFGRFTGRAAPLDVPMRDSGPVPKDQLRKIADIFINDMGMSPEEVLSKPEFVEQGITDLRQLEEGKMKITKRQLRRIIQERVGGGQYSSEPAHRRGHLGKNIADVEFPILVRYSGKSEVVYDQDALDDLLDYLTRENDIAYSLDSLRDVEASDLPAGRGIERYAESRVLKEYSEYPSWSDISDQMDDITDMLDMLADKYVTSAWLYAGENEGNAISSQIAESLEQLYRDAEKLGALVNSRGKLK